MVYAASRRAYVAQRGGTVADPLWDCARDGHAWQQSWDPELLTGVDGPCMVCGIAPAEAETIDDLLDDLTT